MMIRLISPARLLRTPRSLRRIAAPRQHQHQHLRSFSLYRPLLSAGQTPDFNSGFTGSYDPASEGGRGPMFNKTNFGVPQYYPRDLKKRVDDYVVGQDRAKKTICSTIFNHYQSLRRRHQHEQEARERQDRLLRQRFARDREAHQRRRETHPADSDEYAGPAESIRQLHEVSMFEQDPVENLYQPEDPNAPDPIRISKSNLLVVGPTGVGKTYILETLSRKIQVPFAICDCNSLTQAGYIGQDVETCIERLLIEANYDIKAAEHGIVVLDEFDKLARRESSTGRDVGGEGVQQALLKLVEGTKVTINIKDNRSSRQSAPTTTAGSIPPNYNPPGVGTSSLPQATLPQGKVDQYTIDTTNILFVFCGAFVGLDKAVTQRVAKPAMGFGGEVQGRSTMSGSTHHLPREAFAHLAHFNEHSARSFTPLDLVMPEDLQRFGFIPELIGRLHNICALSPLSKNDLYRILTEPRNSLVAQYTALFETYPSRLYFTERALHAIAERAVASQTGARGLKMEMERILAEPMFDAPTPYVLITESCVKGTEKASYWGRDGRFELDRRLEEEQVTPLTLRHASYEELREAGADSC